MVVGPCSKCTACCGGDQEEGMSRREEVGGLRVHFMRQAHCLFVQGNTRSRVALKNDSQPSKSLKAFYSQAIKRGGGLEHDL